VISVQAIVLSLESLQIRRNHNWLKSLSFFFSPALRGAGLWGACFLGAEVIDRALARGNYKIDDMARILKSGPEWDWSKNGSFEGLSGRSGAVKIRDRIAAELADESGMSLKAVMRQIAEDL
jgi:hypothetical protein